jgi:hypothetical protein
MTMKPVPVFHLGMTRCASTFLQLEVFPLLTRREFIRDGLSRKITALGYAHCSQMDEQVVKPFRELAGKSVLLSNEGILCTKRAYTGKLFWEDTLVIANLKELYGENCKILVVIRRQDTIIESMIRYKQRYISDANMLLVDFPVRRSVFGALRYEALFDKLLSSYNYYRSLVPLLTLFGKDRLFVLPYEQLIADKRAFFGRLSECMDEDLTHLADRNLPRRNEKSKKLANLPEGYVKMGHVARKLNNLTGHRLEKLLPTHNRALDEKQSQDVLKPFLEDNRRLDGLFGLNLKSYGYY